jgi:hypothetical protein
MDRKETHEIRQVAVGVATGADRQHISLIRLPEGETTPVAAPRGATVVLSVEGATTIGYSVLGFSVSGGLAADSWFQTLGEARAYATAAFAIGQTAWIDVPAGVLDMHGYALQYFGLGEAEA